MSSTMVQHVPLALPEPRDELLPHSPLRLVVFQLRFTPTEAVRELRAGLAAQEKLGRATEWRLEPVQVQSISLSAGAERPVATSVDVSPSGWRLIAEEGGGVATVLPDSVSLEVTAYRGWPTFRRSAMGLIEAIVQTVNPQAETRLGLRYINRIEQPTVENPREWNGLIERNVLGVINHSTGEALTAAQQQLQLRITEDAKATVQHGFLRDPVTNRLTYLLDFDVFREGARALNIESAAAAIDSLHHSVLQLFQSFITQELYEVLRAK